MSRAEGHAAAGRRHHHVGRHLRARFRHEIQPAAMHRNENVGLELLDLGDHLREVLFRRGAEMEAAPPEAAGAGAVPEGVFQIRVGTPLAEVEARLLEALISPIIS